LGESWQNVHAGWDSCAYSAAWSSKVRWAPQEIHVLLELAATLAA
jgi:hypothetical protein